MTGEVVEVPVKEAHIWGEMAGQGYAVASWEGGSDFIHPGDGLGRLLVNLRRCVGTDAAARSGLAYLRKLNELRTRDGAAPVMFSQFVETLPNAFNNVPADEVADIKQHLERWKQHELPDEQWYEG